MKRTTVYRIRTRGLGLVPGVYSTRALAEQHAPAWSKADIAAHGATTPRGSAFGVIGIEEESLYTEGGDDIPAPFDLPRPIATTASFAVPPVVIEAHGTVTNPGG